jgi:galactokinase
MIRQKFRERFHMDAQLIASAPGRVNLIGEHTDYNEGFVLPIGIDRRVHVGAAPRTDHRVVAYSEEFDEEWDLGATVVDNLRKRYWSDYVLAVLRVLTLEGYRVPGMNLYITGGVPVGAGVSSSAALEIALARALCAAMDISWDPYRMARLTRQAENEFVGIQSGIMDQVTAAAARAGSAMLLDCRSLAASYIRLPKDVAIVVMDTGTRRTLGGTEYNARHSVCQYVVSRIRSIAPGVRALRDVNAALLETARVLLDNTAYRRAKHVVLENERPRALATALSAGKFGDAGALMDESHTSLRELYEVSSVHLDLICDAARAHPACYGARMTGAGFGGCGIALVRADGVDAFMREARANYEARSYKRSNFFAVSADDGARLDAFD